MKYKNNEEWSEPRYTVICWDDDCCLDTYGYGCEYLTIALEHAEETGHYVSVNKTQHLKLN